jgi:hypothetical protein
MIDENIKIHNRFSFEIKLGFMARKKAKISEFAVNSWLFIPNSLDVNSSNYEKKDFYRDLKTNIRLITPVFLLRDICKGGKSPLALLEKAMISLAGNPTRTNISNFEYHIKIFVSIVKSAVRNESHHITQNNIREDAEFLIETFIKNIEEITRAYRKLRRIINVPTVQKDLMNYYLFGDEFMSNVIEQHAFRLLRYVLKQGVDKKSQHAARLSELIKNERNFKHQKGFAVVSANESGKNRELLHRLNLLKRYAENVLFVSARRKKEGFVKEQVYYSLAAGFSMVFATAVAFSFQMKYGNLTMPFFVALVISYMLKDRIKDLMRYYFAHRLGRGYFDHKTTINLNENDIGWSKEAVDFIPEDKVPVEVIQVRNRSAILEADNRHHNEKIILYRKLVRINRQKLNLCSVYPLGGINEIVRFSITGFTNKMDNPEIPLHCLDEHNDPILIQTEKIYYLNLIMQLKHEDQLEYKRYRLVMNREGIKEIESFE